MREILAVLFDIDGTLVDSNERHVEVWARVFRDGGHPIDPDVIRKQIGKGGDNLVPALLPDLPEDEQDALTKRHGKIFKQEYLEGIQQFPHAHDLLRAVRDTGRKTVLASSASGKELDHYVDLLDAKDLLAATTSKDDAESSKPDPDIFAVALKKIGVEGRDAIVVGDTPYDVDAAIKCGAACIAVLSGGFAEAELREAGAIAIYRDASELLAKLDESPIAR